MWRWWRRWREVPVYDVDPGPTCLCHCGVEAATVAEIESVLRPKCSDLIVLDLSPFAPAAFRQAISDAMRGRDCLVTLLSQWLSGPVYRHTTGPLIAAAKHDGAAGFSTNTIQVKPCDLTHTWAGTDLSDIEDAAERAERLGKIWQYSDAARCM